MNTYPIMTDQLVVTDGSNQIAITSTAVISSTGGVTIPELTTTDLSTDTMTATDVATQSLTTVNLDLAGCSLSSGVGVPLQSGNLGDIFIRTDTPNTAGQRIYICTTPGTTSAAAWEGIL